jgi:hypothetical protein
MLLDRIVASGASGVEPADSHDWVLTRLIDLRYVEENPLDNAAFVCTLAGRHRWQIEMLADEQRAATTLRRQLIRDRVYERISNLEPGASTALAVVFPPMEPRLRGGPELPAGRLGITRRLNFALATLFATSAAALVLIIGSNEPQDMRAWFSPPKLHVVAAPVVAPKARVEVAAAVAAPVAIIATLPIDKHTEDVVVRTAVSIDWTSMARSAREQLVSVAGRTLAKVEEVSDAAIRNAAATAVAMVEPAVSESGQFAADLTANVESSFDPMVVVLLHATAETAPAAAAADTPAPQVRVDSPTLVAIVTPAPEPAPAPPATPVAIARAAPEGHVTAKGPPARADDAQVDPQHAAVEKLNTLSLAAARQGVAWRPTGRRDVAQTDRPAWR